MRRANKGGGVWAQGEKARDKEEQKGGLFKRETKGSCHVSFTPKMKERKRERSQGKKGDDLVTYPPPDQVS